MGLSWLPHPLSSARQRPLRDTANTAITGGGAVTVVYILTQSCLINRLKTEESHTEVCLWGHEQLRLGGGHLTLGLHGQKIWQSVDSGL